MTVQTKQLITKKISLPSYTFGEEMINSLSHAIGTGLSIAGLVILLICMIGCSTSQVRSSTPSLP